MKQVIGQTESLCPVCLGRIAAQKVEEDGSIYMEKFCARHGEFRALIWRQDSRHYLKWAEGSEPGAGAFQRFSESARGCPYDCGLCPEHQTRACSMVIELTTRCNLKCPVCFASSGETGLYEPDIETIRSMYKAVKETMETCTIQFSGGEPTLRDDLPQIIALGREMGFDHILVSTNGIRIAREPDFLKKLKDSGCGAIYLQFDGVTDDVYRYTRGLPLTDVKKQALENCAKEQIGVILVPTVIHGVNDDQLGDIIQFAKSWIPTVKGVHFQPVSHFGRYPQAPSDEERTTIPDIINALESQTCGELKWEHFLPRHVRDAHCSFSSFFILTEEGKLQSMSALARQVVTGSGARTADPQESALRFISRHWRFKGVSPEEQNSFYSRLLAYNLTITCMAFQEVWTVDLNRLRGCCLQVMTPDKRIVPFCANYLTSTSGERLYPGPLPSESSEEETARQYSPET